MLSDKGRGRFVWFDLMTPDAEGAVAFYSDVIGWSTERWQDGTYLTWTREGTPLGGLMEVQPAEGPPRWLGHLGTDDMDATVRSVREAGGAVMVEPQDVPSVGRYAIIEDPQGAAVALFQADGGAPGHDGPAGVGEFSWHELATPDPDHAWRFYTALCGWRETDVMDMGDMGVYRMYGLPGGPPMGGIFRKPPELHGPPAWLFYVRVPDVNRAAERVRASGGKVMNGPMEVPGGDWIAQCSDPQGALFALHQTGGGA